MDITVTSKTGENPAKCNLCNEEFSDALQLIPHLRNHVKKSTQVDANDEIHFPEGSNEKVQCDLCGKSFANQEGYKRHFLYVHDCKTSHECDICRKTFNDKRKLYVHVKGVHEKSKHEKCDVCNNLFRCLKIHKR